MLCFTLPWWGCSQHVQHHLNFTSETPFKSVEDHCLLLTLMYQIHCDTLQLFACSTWLAQLFGDIVLNRSNQNCWQTSWAFVWKVWTTLAVHSQWIHSIFSAVGIQYIADENWDQTSSKIRPETFVVFTQPKHQTLFRAALSFLFFLTQDYQDCYLFFAFFHSSTSPKEICLLYLHSLEK